MGWQGFAVFFFGFIVVGGNWFHHVPELEMEMALSRHSKTQSATLLMLVLVTGVLIGSQMSSIRSDDSGR